MAPLKQRIVWRAVPVGLATAVVGYGLLWCYLAAASTFNRGTTIQSDGPSYFGLIVIGLAGFAISAALECVRRNG